MRRYALSMILALAILFSCLTAFAGNGEPETESKKDSEKIKEKFGVFQSYMKKRPNITCCPRPTYEPTPSQKPEKEKNKTCRSDIPRIPSVFETEYESEPTVCPTPTPTPVPVTTVIYEVPAKPQVIYVYNDVPKTGDETKELNILLLLSMLLMPAGIIVFAKKTN